MSRDECLECGDSYEKLSIHWNLGSCDYPTVSERVKEISIGLVMGDANVDTSNATPYIGCEMVTPEFLEWVSNEFEVLGNEVRFRRTAEEQARSNGADPEGYRDVYDWSSRCHPWFFNLASWYDSGEKRLPGDLSLTPLMTKVWYACDGGLNWYRKSHSRASAAISCKNEEDRKDFLVELFRDEGFNVRMPDHQIMFTVEETYNFLEWMGDPLPGFEYKWSNEKRVRYLEGDKL